MNLLAVLFSFWLFLKRAILFWLWMEDHCNPKKIEIAFQTSLRSMWVWSWGTVSTRQILLANDFKSQPSATCFEKWTLWQFCFLFDFFQKRKILFWLWMKDHCNPKKIETAFQTSLRSMWVWNWGTVSTRQILLANDFKSQPSATCFKNKRFGSFVFFLTFF